MATITELPPGDIIQAFKGTLDYYVWRGLPCVRTWPRWTLTERSTAVVTAQQAFADYTRRVAATDPFVVQQANAAADGQPWTWRDITTSAAYQKLSS